MSAFVDMDICKARTTKVTSVERVDSGFHKPRRVLVSGSGNTSAGSLDYKLIIIIVRTVAGV